MRIVQQPSPIPKPVAPTPAVPTGRWNLFSKHPVWWLTLVILCLVFTIAVPDRRSEREVVWAYALGSVFGMFLVGFVLAGIPYGASLLSRKRMTSHQFMSTFSVAILLVAVAHIFVSINETDSYGDMSDRNLQRAFAAKAEFEKQEAIRIAKHAKTWDTSLYNDFVVREWLEKMSGDLKVTGWDATDYYPVTAIISDKVCGV